MGQGPCLRNLHMWGLAKLAICECSQQQMMNHRVDMRPLTKSEGELQLLPNVEGHTLSRLETTATTAIVK